MQDFFTSARLHRVHKNVFTKECKTFVAPKIKEYYRSEENQQYRKT